MAKKKNKAVLVVREDDMVLAQPLFDEYHELSPLKNIRKEARRALIHMEEARIYPRWSMPTRQTSPYRIVEPNIRANDEEMPFADFDDGFDEDEDEDEFDDYDEEDDVDFIEISPQDVVGTFVRLWVKGRFRRAYDLLTDDSPLRGGLAKDAWVERRKAWAEEAKLYRNGLETSFIYERTAQETERWLPNEMSVKQATIDHETNHKTIVLDWSMMYSDISFNEPLPELPQATLVYGKTGRHWFWSSYVLIEQEDSSWRIHSMTDEGLNALHLPATVLRERIETHKNFIDELRQKYKPGSMEEVAPFVDESLWRIIQTIHYYDALVEQLPQERSLYEEIAARMLASFQYERAMVYMDLMAERFPEVRAETLRLLAGVQRKYSDTCYEEGDDERALRFIELAKENLRESLAIENTLEAHVVLAELLTEDMEGHLNEAEEHLREAKALGSGPVDEANVEIHLGRIDSEREQDEGALHHFQRATELGPNFASAWFNLADAYDKLENVEAAIESYRHAIQLQPDDENLYVRLSLLYKSERQDDMAIEILKEGLDANPESLDICISLATFYMTIDDYEQAEEYLDKATQIDADAPTVDIFRSMLTSMRSLATAKPTGRNVDAATPARRVVESIPDDRERTDKPFQPSHPKKKKRKKR